MNDDGNDLSAGVHTGKQTLLMGDSVMADSGFFLSDSDDTNRRRSARLRQKQAAQARAEQVAEAEAAAARALELAAAEAEAQAAAEANAAADAVRCEAKRGSGRCKAHRADVDMEKT